MIARARKFAVAVVGVIALALSAGLVAGTARTVLTAVLAVATALGVYVVPNAAPAAPKPPAAV